MPVTIDELQIEVKGDGTSAPAQAPAAAQPKVKVDVRKQMELLAERAARLTAE